LGGSNLLASVWKRHFKLFLCVSVFPTLNFKLLHELIYQIK
jgi:hypothetical protein